ncbi:YIEGIA family protein [Niallia taxi]|uniref:YIEGIA family protein n=1 Tax=Niallia taxi TaxID=2499688 RepID=UPI00119E9349|nr:YIEGIA family protein [Niallia taxi]MCT2345311.1 YIEGIA family protein [Niallia taxi]MDE5052014.1 YIEGIA family protein [Niallia taxi]MED3961866.1 YIEGIA family protein [Niallia taxi]WOD64636.1 YIEGIA family protein [Niallia taxi]
MTTFTYPIMFGLVIGTALRMFMLRTDYRQYPTYLHGKIIHIALGFIAAGLGTVAIPSILDKDFTAVTFLTVAASQFRDVRNMERNTLTELDSYEMVPRGKTYIEGIAIAFESRNYLVMFASLLSTFGYITFQIWGGIVAAIISFFISRKLMSGGKLRDIVTIDYVEPRFDGPGLYVDNIYIMNIGIPARQEEVLKYGMGFILTPKNFNARTTIANLGQRQAILYDVSTALGVYRDSGTPALVPLAKRDLEDGRVAVFILPQNNEKEKALEIIGAVPTLENAIRMPSKRLRREEEAR